jgi:hypothetical protein
MGRLFKFLIYLIILAAIGIVAYAYLGPIFDPNFTAPQTEIRQPVTLEGN